MLSHCLEREHLLFVTSACRGWGEGAVYSGTWLLSPWEERSCHLPLEVTALVIPARAPLLRAGELQLLPLLAAIVLYSHLSHSRDEHWFKTSVLTANHLTLLSVLNNWPSASLAHITFGHYSYLIC